MIGLAPPPHNQGSMDLVDNNNKSQGPNDITTEMFVVARDVWIPELPKPANISLMSHVTKLVLLILINIIRGIILHENAPEQYGFMLNNGI